MSGKTEARERLLQYLSVNDTANEGYTPDQLIDDAIHEAILNQPALRTCFFPGCLRQFDVISCMAGDPPPRPEWDGRGWATLGAGTIISGGGHVCPDHKSLVTQHLPKRLQLPNDRRSTECACGWTAQPQRYYPLLRGLWEEHLLTENGTLPPAAERTDR